MAFVHQRDYRQLTPSCCDDCRRRQAYRWMAGENGTSGVKPRTDIPQEYLPDYLMVYWAAYRNYHGQPVAGGDGHCPSCGCGPTTRGQVSPACIRQIRGRGQTVASACSCHWPPVARERTIWVRSINDTTEEPDLATALCDDHLGLCAASYTRYGKSSAPGLRCCVCGAVPVSVPEVAVTP